MLPRLAPATQSPWHCSPARSDPPGALSSRASLKRGPVTDRAAILAELLADPTRAASVSRGDAAALLVELSALQVALVARLAVIDAATIAPPHTADRLLTPAEVAERFGRSVDWVYRMASRWPFTVREGRKTVRFSQAGLEKHLRAKTSGRC